MFDYPYNVTKDYGEENLVEVTFWNSTLFLRGIDGHKVPSGTKVDERLPKFINESWETVVKTVGVAISEASIKSLIALFVLNFFLTFAMNQVLSQVRNHAIIVHSMLIQLNYAAISSFFFGMLVECVNFDLI